MKTYKLKVYQDNILLYTIEATFDYIQVAIKNLSKGQHYELVLIN
jgi:hypothetical protein